MVKLVINTNSHYTLALKKLFGDLIDIKYPNFLDIVVVISESEKNSEPTIMPIFDLVGIETEKCVVVIESVLNNYDYAGFNALYLNAEHYLIKSEYYFYLLDTSSVGPNFYQKIIELTNKYPNKKILAPKVPNSNIILFKYDMIDIYRDMYNRSLSKKEAIWVEHSVSFRSPDGVLVTSVINLANGDVIILGEREHIGRSDIYNNGYIREIYYYSDFDVTKYVLHNKDGDFKNNVINLQWE